MEKIDLNLENEIHHFGLDHLEVFGTFKYEEDLFDKLDFDNSNYGEIEEYTFTKNEVNKFKYKIIFSKENYSLFAYYKGIPKGPKQGVGTKDYIVVYSTAFKLLEYEEILYFLEFYFNLKHCRRFDICIDLKVNIEHLLKYFNNFNTGREYKKSGKIETRYIGEVKNSLNKRQLIRIYDKYKDIVAKKKLKLYNDYLIQDNITRVEIEIRQELAKNRNYKDIFDNALLFGIFKNYIYKHCKIFDLFGIEKITLHKKRETIDAEKYQSLYYKTQRVNIFLGHLRTIYNMGFCPVRIAINEGFIQDKTKQILGFENIHEIIKREKKLIIEVLDEKYNREEQEKILDNLYKYGRV